MSLPEELRAMISLTRRECEATLKKYLVAPYKDVMVIRKYREHPYFGERVIIGVNPSTN
jgi:hypothetical protein